MSIRFFSTATNQHHSGDNLSSPFIINLNLQVPALSTVEEGYIEDDEDSSYKNMMVHKIPVHV